jgi:hypothetical protein
LTRFYAFFTFRQTIVILVTHRLGRNSCGARSNADRFPENHFFRRE